MNEYFSSITHMMPELKIGDQAAWNKLCEKFRLCLNHKAQRLLFNSNTTASLSAEDLVQDSLLKAWKCINTFEGRTTAQFTAWIFKIIHNTFLDWCKSNKLNAVRNLNLSWFDFADGADSPSKILIDEEAESRLYASLAELDSKYQTVIILRHFDGLKFRQIADKLQLNPNTTASYYRRGIEELKGYLK